MTLTIHLPYYLPRIHKQTSNDSCFQQILVFNSSSILGPLHAFDIIACNCRIHARIMSSNFSIVSKSLLNENYASFKNERISYVFHEGSTSFRSRLHLCTFKKDRKQWKLDMANKKKRYSKCRKITQGFRRPGQTHRCYAIETMHITTILPPTISRYCYPYAINVT